MIIGKNTYHKHKVQSSFAWAKENLSSPSGTVFIADYIEKARGRSGRTWSSDIGQALMTILLKPDTDKNLNNLNMALSLGVYDALKDHEVKLKWPNDFMVNDKKLGGMLIESVWQGGKLCALLVGIGINVNNKIFPKELSNIATSLYCSSGRSFDLKMIINKLLFSLDKHYQMWLDGEHDEIYNSWKNAQGFKQLTVHKKDGTYIDGVLEDFTLDGDLILRNGNELTTISFNIVEEVKKGKYEQNT